MPKTANSLKKKKGGEREKEAPDATSSRFAPSNKEPFLVTGGTGFLGVALIQLLISKGACARPPSSPQLVRASLTRHLSPSPGHRVRVLVRNSDPALAGRPGA